MNNVIIGSHGMVGRALMEYLSDSIGTYYGQTANPVAGRKYEYLDITEKGKVDEFFEKNKPKRVFLAAADAHVDRCENLESDKVNVDGTARVISNCATVGAQVIFFSSAYVFNGESESPYKTTDPTFPINRYGRQKEATEKFMIGYHNLEYLIIRTVGVFGKEAFTKNFVSQVVRAVSTGKKIHVPVDQTMNPVYAGDLAKTVIHLSDRYSREIFHVAGNRCISKYEFAIKVAYLVGCERPHELIIGTKSEDMNQVAPRPKNGCLDCRGLQKYSITIPSFSRGLKKYLDMEKT